MAFLGKKRDYDDEEYEDDEDSEERPKRRTNKDFKDLKPENKKRREPKKPWGKKERFFILFIVLLTAGTSGILALSARAWKLPGLPRIKLPSFSLPFFSEETIILEGDKSNINNQMREKGSIRAFKNLTSGLSGVYGLYIIHLDNGYSYGINQNEIFQAASLIKLPVMAGMYMEEESGELDLNSKYKLKSSDKVSGAGSLYGKPAGYEITYRDLVRLMGKQSDNTAFNIARKLLGDEKISGVINKIGMKNTSLDKNETTPKDIGTFFEELWKGNIVSKESRDEILGNLTDTIYEDWLVAGIPQSTRIAHKYGREVHVVNDAGIVFAPKPYVIVLMTKGIIEKEADDFFPEISRKIFEIQTEEGN